jgi:bifunctional DNase/RNase
MTEMRVRALTQGPDPHQALVILETTTGDRCLGLIVPGNEAGRLAQVLGLMPCSCTPIYDLVLGVLGRVGGRVVRTTVVGAPDGVAGALVLSHEGVEFVLSCHPADGLALALRSQSPIYATPEALAHACPSPGTEPAPGADDVARWIAAVRPADFEQSAEAGG